MKHLLLLAVVIVAFQAIATSAIDTILFKQHGSIQYSDDVLSNDIIEQLKLDMSLSEQQQSHRGHVMVDHNIFQRIKDVAGSAIDINDLIDANTGGVKLQTRFINESTQPHVDRYHHNNEVVDDDVMFVALDSNPKAHFTHGDSSIPAVAGRLFRFNGSIKHGTTFNGGNPIRLLGPFSTKNFASVGTTGAPTSPPPSTTPPPPTPPPQMVVFAPNPLFDLFNCLIGLGVPPFFALFFAIISLCLNDPIDCMEMEEMMEALNDKGGIRGRRILEDKENLKALLTSLLKEKLDDGINIKLEGVITEAMESLGVDIRGHRILESKEDLKALLVSLQEKLNEY